MKRRIVFSIALLLAATACLAQDTAGTFPLKSSGLIPDENLTRSFEKYVESRKNIVLELRRKERLLMDKFYLETNYWIDDFQRGGKVLFGHVINQYINTIVDSLLVDRPELREQIHCYLVKSSAVNAFATDRGNIYVTLGLIAKVRTEAELASVLSHEINHYMKKHVLKGFIKEMNIDLITDDSPIEENPGEDLLVRRHNYSQQMEFEADTSGFNLLTRSSYNLNAAVTVCDLLGDADSPFDDKPIDKAFFETQLYSLPEFSAADSSDSTVTETTATVQGEKTHPDVPERKALLAEKLGEINSTSDTLYNRFNFLQPKTLFDSIRMMSRLALPHIMLHENRFEDAIYSAYLLKGAYPENKHLDKVIAFGLTGMMLHKRYPALGDDDWEKYLSGRAREVHDFFSGLSAREFNLVVIAYLLSACNKHEGDRDFETAFNNAAYNLVKCESDFVAAENTPADTAKDFSSVLFLKLLRSGSRFSDSFEKQKIVVAKEAELRQWYNGLSQKERKALEQKKFAERADKIIVLNPLAMVLNYKQESYDFVESEQKKTRYDVFFEQMAAQKKYNIEFINPLSMEKDDVERFNDYAVLNDWMESMLGFGESKFNTCFERELKEVSAKYKARYVLWGGTMSVKYLPVISDNAIMISILAVPLAPFILIPKLSPHYYSMYFSVVMDLEKNLIVHREMSKVSERKPERVLKTKTNALLKRLF